MYIKFGILVLSGLIVACSPAENPKKPIDDSRYTQGWEFMRSDTALDLAAAKAIQDWAPVELPHTPRLEPLEATTPFQGDSWYRNTITALPEWQGKHISLAFEAAMNNAEIWLDDEKIASHHGGYLPFRINLTDKLIANKTHQVLVRLDNRDNPVTGPKPLRELAFNTYGGLYRPVYLHIDNDLHITDPIAANKPGSGGIRVTYPDISRERALIDVQTHVANLHYNPKQFRIVQRLMWGDKVVTDQSSKLLHIEGNSEAEHHIQLTLANPQLWSPQHPHLYHLVTRVYDGNSLVEEETTRIGIRQFEFMDGELFINGEKKRLRGVNRYQEYPWIGFATSAAADYRDAVHIKSAGFDAVRLAHYPQSSAFLAAADELGLVVINAIPGWGYFSEDPAFQAQVQQTCRDLIRRDRNHPSVLAWECSLDQAPMSSDFASSLSAIVHEEIPGALAAGRGEYKNADMLLVSLTATDEIKQQPAKPWAISHYGQPDSIAENLDSNMSTSAFADFYTSIFDYHRGYAPHLQTAGLMNITRQPKHAYYFFQSQRDPDEKSTAYASGPMVFIASDWTPGSALAIPVFSNAEQVELLLNGKSLGKQTPDTNTPHLSHPPFRFTLEKFVPGELKAIAYRKGNIVAEHRVITPGDASSLRLHINTAGKAPQAGVKDVLFVYAQLTDATGNPAYNDEIMINFTLEGHGKLISPAQTRTHKGMTSALIEIGDALEGLHIIAEAENLAPATLKIK